MLEFPEQVLELVGRGTKGSPWPAVGSGMDG